MPKSKGKIKIKIKTQLKVVHYVKINQTLNFTHNPTLVIGVCRIKLKENQPERKFLINLNKFKCINETNIFYNLYRYN